MSPKQPRHNTPSEEAWIESFHDALCVIEDSILTATDDEYRASPLLQRAALGAFEEIRTAAQHLTKQTLGRMPEVAASDIADVRNLALYEYPTNKSIYVLRTLRNQAAIWRDGIDRARGQTRDGVPVPPMPSRTDGTLQKVRRQRAPLCGRPVPSNGDAPCILRRGHQGRCRSR